MKFGINPLNTSLNGVGGVPVPKAHKKSPQPEVKILYHGIYCLSSGL
jgi:hypothetical protein